MVLGKSTNFSPKPYHLMSDAFIFDALRTPRGRGKTNGSLYEVKPLDLLGTALEKLRLRNQLDTKEVNDAIIGCVTPTDDQGFNIAKAALIHAGWHQNVGGLTINRFCASGLEAINLTAAKIKIGWSDLMVAGGLESMSRVPMGSDSGPLMYDPELINRADYIPQGISADLIATIEGFSREDVDAFALSSHHRAAAAMQAGYFSKSLVPIYDRSDLLILDHDEYARPDTDEHILQRLRPSFAATGALGFDEMALHKYPLVEKINHVHTAGNSSGIVDAAAVVLMGSKEKGQALGLKPRARILSIGNASVEPTLMLTGPGPAAKQALQRAKMQAKDIDLWECNEAFAAVVLKFQRDLDIPHERLNVNGGAIAMGHPLGATGAILLGTLLDEMERRNVQTGLVTLCVGGGMGVATIIERI